MENLNNKKIINLKNNDILLLVCPICQEVLNSEKDWITHMKTHIPDVKEDSEFDQIYNILNSNFPNCKIQIATSAGIKNHCKYDITLITKYDLKINLKYKFSGEIKEKTPTYPNSTEELVDDIKYILNIINTINNLANKKYKFYNFKCLEYCSYVNILENNFIFQFKPNKNSEDYIKETFNPTEQDINMFIDMLNKYETTEIQGDVYIDNIDNGGWGDTFYINNIDIESLMKRAVEEGRQVLLKMI